LIEVGPADGSISIDGLPLPDIPTIIMDSNERISDIISEGLLREKNLATGLLEYSQREVVPQDPALSPVYRSYPNIQRYIRRLALRDYAENGASIRLAYPRNESVSQIISKSKEYAIKLNERYLQAPQAFDEIFKLCVGTDFQSFRYPENVVNYTKRVMDSLNLKIETLEKW